MNKVFAQLLSRLTALKGNLPKSTVDRKYADEFNSIITELETISSETLTDFKISASEIRPRIVSSNYITGEKSYSPESYCDRNFLLMKIDGVLGYFTLLLQPVEIKDQMGFNVERK
jgi:hypothetical protein